jgi:hypothetical protein
MKIELFGPPQPEPRKNGRRRSFLTHALALAYTLPTPQIAFAPDISPATGGCGDA